MLLWPFLLHCSGNHWHVCEGLCQITVPVTGGAEPVPHRSAWSSLLHLSDSSLFDLFFFSFCLKKSCLGLLLGVSLRKHPSWKINLWFFLPKLLVHVLYNSWGFFKDWTGWKSHRFFPICRNLCFKARKWSVISTEKPSTQRLSYLRTELMLKHVKHQ